MKSIIIILLLSLSMQAQVVNISDFEGIWENDGYGRIVEIKKKKTYIYDICKIDCTEAQVISNKALFNEFIPTKINDSSLVIQSGISKYYFKKLAQLPELCNLKNKEKDDSIYNFEVLWQTFNEHYCYFNERNIDWNALKEKYGSQITSQTTPFELFLVMDNMVSEFNDSHSNMFIPDKLEKEYENYRLKKQEKRKKEIRDSLGESYKFVNIHIDSMRLKAIGSYVKKVKTYNYGVLNYGLVNDELAIVQINGMEQFANYNIPEGISESKAEKIYEKNAAKSINYTQDNANGAAYITEKVISDIKDTKACIIDIRFNGGGYDEVQLEILKRFAKKDTIAVYKKARNKKGFTKKTPIVVTPTKNAYKGKVFILTSHQTASAAEDFVLCAMSAVPNAVRIGSNTEGIFSDILNKKLPNGWDYSLSNEIYESPNGVHYEVVGISPDYQIEYPKKAYWFYRYFYDNNTGQDEAVEKVLELLENNLD